VVLHLLTVPAGADAELQPSPGEVVDAGDLLGRGDRVALVHQTDPAAHPQCRRRRGRRRERDEQVVGVGVLAGKLAAARIGSASVGRDMGVLREEQRLVTALFDQPRERPGSDGRGRGENGDTDVHGRTVRRPLCHHDLENP
jgi:hypothetical protein